MALTEEQLTNADLDIKFINDVATSEQPTATNRLGKTVKTLAQVIEDTAFSVYGAPSWAALNAIVPTEGNVIAEVLGDGGTHIDPVTDASVPNSGRFAFIPGEGNGWTRQGAALGDGLLAYASRGVRSPFQADASLNYNLTPEQYRNLILDIDLSDWEDYNPARFYSAAEIYKDNTSINFRVYEQTTPGAYVFPAKFSFRATTTDGSGYDPSSKDILVLTTDNGVPGKMAIVPSAIPNTPVELSGMAYQVAGFDDHVFRKGFGLLANLADLDVASIPSASPVDRHLVGAFASDVAFLHPNEPVEHTGDGTFPNAPGLGQWHRFTEDAVVERIETAMFTSAGQTFKGKIQVVRFTSNIELVGPAPANGELVQEFIYPAGAYPEDFVLELAEPAFFNEGEQIAVYIRPDDGFQINMRYWDTPRTNQPNPNKRTGMLFRSGGTGEWGFGSATTTYAYYQVPLRLYTNIVSRDEVRAIAAAAGTGGGGSTLPRLVLPSKVHAVVGLEFNLYYDAISMLPDVGLGTPSMLFDVVCDVGRAYKRGFRVTPDAGMVGNHQLTVIAYSTAGEVIEQVTTTLVVKAAANPSAVKRIVSIADSTWDDTGVTPKTLQENLAAIGGNVPVFLGSHGVAPYNMEARSGQTLDYYANGGNLRFKFTVTGFPNVPFWPLWLITAPDDSGYILGYEEAQIAGGSGWFIGVVGAYPNSGPIADGWTGQLKLNGAVFNVTATQALPKYSIFKENGTGPLSFANYISRKGYAGCDLLLIDLGINDSRGALQADDVQQAKITAAKAVMTSALAYNPNMKIIIGLTKSGASTINSPATGTQHNSYRLNIHRFRELLIENFDNDAFHANVSVCAAGLMVDRYYGYPLLDAQPVAARLPYTETIHGDLVHPQPEGSRQSADGWTGAVLAALT